MVADFDLVSAALSGQPNLLKFWDRISEEDRVDLTTQLKSLDIPTASKCFTESADIYTADPANLTPVAEEHRAVVSELDDVTRKHYWKLGLEAVAKGEVAALVLSGGQASRLGSSCPKGTVALGLNICPGDSLLGLQAAKLARLEQLAHKEYPTLSGKIQWLVMSSKSTEKATKEHLEKVVPEAGLSWDQVTLFSQAEIPAFDMDGNLFLASKNSIVTSPNGNGGVYAALAEHLPVLKERGVKYFHVYCIDNILCKVADPYFIGYAADKGADVVTKTVVKRQGELVGSVCLDSGRPRITEYSELGADLAEKKAANGRYLFGDGSIANHLFTMEFLQGFCTPSFHLPYHRAHKKIAHLNADGELVKPENPNGIKLEQFIFDVFHMSKNFYIWEVKREDEFSPLKNAETAGVDCLSTCRRDLGEQAKRWLREAGATVETGTVYVSPSLSYDGEGLENASGRVVTETVFA